LRNHALHRIAHAVGGIAATRNAAGPGDSGESGSP